MKRSFLERNLIDRPAERTPLSRDQARGIWFMSPMILFIVLFILIPVLGTLVDSFFQKVIYLPDIFVWFKNYRFLLSDPNFWNSLRFTVLFVLVSVPLEILLGLAIALVLNEPIRFRGLLRACVLIPWAIPAAVSGRVFELIYNYSYGAANALLLRLGLTETPVNWLGTDWGAFFAIVAADAWKTTPFAAIILLAGLSSIPEPLYAQARIDQASMVRRFFRITLPLIKPVLIVAVLFRTIQALRIFDVIFVLTGGGPGGATESLSLFAYSFFSAGDFGYGSAVSVILFLMAVGISVLYVRAGRFQET